MMFRCTAIVLAALLFAGCSSSGRDDSDSSPGSSGGSSNRPVDVTDACKAACAVQVDCGLLVSYDACVADCVQGGELYDDDCRNLMAKESQCIGELTCEQLDEYSQGRSGNPQCGDAFDAFAGACAINGGVPPAECDRFCERANECKLAVVAEQGCAENCLLTLTGQTLSWGSDCADVQREGFGCLAERTCEELSALFSGNITPAACVHFDEQLVTACR